MKTNIVSTLATAGKPDIICRFRETGVKYDTQPRRGSPSDGTLKTGVEGGSVSFQLNIEAFRRYERDEARRAAAGLSVRELYRSGNTHLCWILDGDPGDDVLSQLLTGALLASYTYDEYRHFRSAKPRERRLTIVAGNNTAAVKRLLARATVINDGVSTARNLANTPPNDLAPLTLAAHAKDLAARCGLGFRQLNAADLAKEGYIGVTSVGQGSVNPPVMFALTYKPASAAKGAQPLCLVGKGITFDTGGISIKPWDGMWDMKADMGGSAAVLGAMQAISQLQLPVPVVAVVASAENMPDGKSFRPGDILRYRNGVTVEIRSTDAEGRLVLADALLYAQEILKQNRIVEFSTLTGACARALGPQYIGMMSRSSELKEAVMAATVDSGENVWELPLHPEYRGMIDSPICDIRNAGGALAGAQTAGWFLEEFVSEGTQFVHLDIAGVFLAEKEDKYWRQAGATGAGVRLAVELAALSAGGADEA